MSFFSKTKFDLHKVAIPLPVDRRVWADISATSSIEDFLAEKAFSYLRANGLVIGAIKDIQYETEFDKIYTWDKVEPVSVVSMNIAYVSVWAVREQDIVWT